MNRPVRTLDDIIIAHCILAADYAWWWDHYTADLHREHAASLLWQTGQYL